MIQRGENFRTAQQGFGLVEILVSVVIISLTLASIYSAVVQTIRISSENTKKIKATFLAEETIEALRLLRDTSWSSNISSLATDGTNYYLAWSGGTWTTTTTNTPIDAIFERKFTLNEVNRDGNDDIVTSGGTPDASTRLVTARVTWGSDPNQEALLVTYITDIFAN